MRFGKLPKFWWYILMTRPPKVSKAINIIILEITNNIKDQTWFKTYKSEYWASFIQRPFSALLKNKQKSVQQV